MHLTTCSRQVRETSIVIISVSQLKNQRSDRPLAQGQTPDCLGSPRFPRARPARGARHPDEQAQSRASARAGPGPARSGRSGRRDLLPGRRHSPGPGQRGHHNYRPQILRPAAPRRLFQLHHGLAAPLPANCPLLPAGARMTGTAEAQKALSAIFKDVFHWRMMLRVRGNLGPAEGKHRRRHAASNSQGTFESQPLFRVLWPWGSHINSLSLVSRLYNEGNHTFKIEM